MVGSDADEVRFGELLIYGLNAKSCVGETEGRDIAGLSIGDEPPRRLRSDAWAIVSFAGEFWSALGTPSR
jgi:hypothetical protein